MKEIAPKLCSDIFLLANHYDEYCFWLTQTWRPKGNVIALPVRTAQHSAITGLRRNFSQSNQIEISHINQMLNTF